MAATILNSERAVQMSVFVVRAFVRLREMLATNRTLAAKISELENHSRLQHQKKLLDAIQELVTPPDPPRRRIGFQLPVKGVRRQ